MKSPKKHSYFSALAPLLLFVIFTTCILFVLLTGADTYKKLSLRDQNSFQHRTVVQYLTTRIRQSDVHGRIQVRDFSSDVAVSQGNTLVLEEEIDGRIYHTRIYSHDGYLQELFTPAGLEFFPSDGDKVLVVNSLYFSLEHNRLSVQIIFTDNSTQTLQFYLRNSGEVTS